VTRDMVYINTLFTFFYIIMAGEVGHRVRKQRKSGGKRVTLSRCHVKKKEHQKRDKKQLVFHVLKKQQKS